jgi:hypothetical protein
MDVTNSSGDDTQYRLAGGGKVISEDSCVGWQDLAHRTHHQCRDLQAPWTIEFKMPSGKIVSATYRQRMASVTLVKVGSGYRINGARKPAEKPVKPPKPTRKPPTKPVKDAKPTKAKNAA